MRWKLVEDPTEWRRRSFGRDVPGKRKGRHPPRVIGDRSLDGSDQPLIRIKRWRCQVTAFGSGEYVPPKTAQELLQRYAGGERRFHGLDLSEADLSGATLDGAEFDGSWFFDADFERASLRGTSFRLCNVKCANFRRADLTSASFQLAAVEAAEFEGAALAGASIEGASCYGYTIRDDDGFPGR